MTKQRDQIHTFNIEGRIKLFYSFEKGQLINLIQASQACAAGRLPLEFFFP